MSDHPLTPRQIAHYRRHGYVVVESLFSPRDLAPIEEAIRELTDRAIASPDAMAKILKGNLISCVESER